MHSLSRVAHAGNGLPIAPADAAALAEYYGRALPRPPWVSLVLDALSDNLTPAAAEGRRNALPYCIRPTSTPGKLCVVNRQYKALTTGANPTWTDYEAATDCHIDAAWLQALQLAGAVDEGGYLFGGSLAPWSVRPWRVNAYRQRLAALVAPWIPNPAWSAQL